MPSTRKIRNRHSYIWDEEEVNEQATLVQAAAATRRDQCVEIIHYHKAALPCKGYQHRAYEKGVEVSVATPRGHES